MSTATLYRWAGIAGIVAGIFNIIIEFVPSSLRDPLDLIVLVLALWALVRLYVRQRQMSGILGFIGCIVNSLGVVLVVGVRFPQAFIFPSLDSTVLEGVFAGPYLTAALISVYIFTVGVVIFGVATIRAEVFPKWAAGLYIVGFLPNFGTLFIPDIIINTGEMVASIAIIWLSYALWAGASEPVGMAEVAR